MKQVIPPAVLIKTWIELLKIASDDEAHIHAKQMLAKTFGSIELAFIYAEDNGIVRRE
jgi:hypothetical protein